MDELKVEVSQLEHNLDLVVKDGQDIRIICLRDHIMITRTGSPSSRINNEEHIFTFNASRDDGMQISCISRTDRRLALNASISCK